MITTNEQDPTTAEIVEGARKILSADDAADLAEVREMSDAQALAEVRELVIEHLAQGPNPHIAGFVVYLDRAIESLGATK